MLFYQQLDFCDDDGKVTNTTIHIYSVHVSMNPCIHVSLFNTHTSTKFLTLNSNDYISLHIHICTCVLNASRGNVALKLHSMQQMFVHIFTCTGRDDYKKIKGKTKWKNNTKADICVTMLQLHLLTTLSRTLSLSFCEMNGTHSYSTSKQHNVFIVGGKHNNEVLYGKESRLLKRLVLCMCTLCFFLVLISLQFLISLSLSLALRVSFS